jgi:enamine deaminase RidA (YjgF/YER057c/UK114 family)
MKHVLCLLLFAQVLCAGWKAGLAKADITPDGPIWLAGYGARTKPSAGVLHPIYVKVLALEDDAGAVSVLVTSDILGFNRDMADTVASQAQSKFGLPRSRLAINSSHTHSAPVTGNVLRPAYPYDDSQQQVIDKYTAKLLAQTVAAIGSAIQDLSPAAISFEQGLAGFAVNRRRVGHREYPGSVDHDVPVLRIAAPDGKLRGIVFGYACHATSLSQYEVNGDWPGFAQAELEHSHPGAMALFVAGCGADANPLPRRTVELSRMYGKILAAAVDAVLGGKMRPVEGSLRAAFELVDLPFQQPPTREELRRRLEDARLRNHARFLLGVLDREGKLADRYPYPVQVWQFGKDLTWIFLGGEVVVDYSLRLKKQHGWDSVWVAGYSNDVMAYIPSLRVLKEGGYEGGGAMIPYGQPASWGAPVEEIIIEKVEQLVAGTNSAGIGQAVVVKRSPLAHTAQMLPDGGSAAEQVQQVFAKLDRVLRQAGSSLEKVVKVNVYLTGNDVAPLVRAAIEKRFSPAASFVVSRLPKSGAVVAMDAVAIAGSVTPRSAEVAVLPAGPRVYISGQASPGDIRKATVDTLATLKGNLEFLGLTLDDVVQVKAFLQPMSSAQAVHDEVRSFFGKEAPPLVLVEWISKSPIEIELIAKSPARSGPPIEYLTPPGEKASRVFTRIARVHHPDTIYVSGLYGKTGADAATEIRQIFESLKGALGGDLRHLVKATYYVTDDTVSRLLNELRPDYLAEGRAPAASKAMVAGAGLEGSTITIDMIAVPAR